MKNNLPEVYAKTAKFLTGSSYLCAKLTGKFTIDRYLAEDFAPLYNLTNTVDEEHCSCIAGRMHIECANATDIADCYGRGRSADGPCRHAPVA